MFEEDCLSDQRPSELTHLNAQNLIDEDMSNSVVLQDKSREVEFGSDFAESESKENLGATITAQSKPNITNQSELIRVAVS